MCSLRWSLPCLVTLVIAGCSSGPEAAGAPQAPAAPALGDLCTTDAACGEGSGLVCLASGRCGTATCTTGACGEGAECFLLGAATRSCLPTCDAERPCGAGLVCATSGACVARCSEGACGPDATCDDASGLCVADVTKRPSAAPIPACDDVPARDCTAGTAACSSLSAFDPKLGPGYEDYPLNGETASNQWRSFARADLQQIVKWSTALVACRGNHWAFGNGAPLGLGDMSESNGAIPGTARGQPGHPAGTHTNGLDMDIGYYQIGTKDNRLRAVCDHMEGGKDVYHCVSEPTALDTWRNALVLGAMVTSRRVRVIGMDGKVGPRVMAALPALCRDGYLDATACTRARTLLTFEETDQGYGWFRFHHHHFHISMSSAAYASAPASFAPSEGRMLWRDGVPASSLERFEALGGHGHVD
jgi:hypothetical protein